MSLYIDNTADPVAILQARNLDCVPKHFVRVAVDPGMHRRNARNWIEKNLTGRYCIAKSYYAFEDPSEATMFALILTDFSNWKF